MFAKYCRATRRILSMFLVLAMMFAILGEYVPGWFSAAAERGSRGGGSSVTRDRRSSGRSSSRSRRSSYSSGASSRSGRVSVPVDGASADFRASRGYRNSTRIYRISASEAVPSDGSEQVLDPTPEGGTADAAEGSGESV